jgi:aminocarboxymuconate-semialdehyde decarboxylase
MPIIDMHAHVTPERYKRAIAADGNWYGLDETVGELSRGGFAQSITERVAEMDDQGVDMQLITPTVGFYQYAMDPGQAARIHRECNAEIAEIVAEHPTRFRGLAMPTMQDPATAIAEMAQAMSDGFAGVVLSDHVWERTYDAAEFLPFFAAAEELGAILFFHQGGGDTCVSTRTEKYKLTNAVGNLVERTLLYGTLVFSGIMDRFPDLKPLLAHGGGYTAYGIARMDKVAGALEGPTGEMTPPFAEADGFLQKRPPSDYLARFHYDCCTYSGPALRFLIDTVGIDQVVLGTDYPAPMFLKDPVRWVNGLSELSDAEKAAILVGNSSGLLGV